MTQAQILQAIRGRFRTLVETPQSLVVVQDNGPGPTAPTAKWCRLSVAPRSKTRLTVGPTPRWEIAGDVTVNLFVSAQQGEAVMLAIVDAIDAAFSGQRLTGPQISFGGVSPVGGPSLDGGWFARVVRWSYRAYAVGAA